VAPNPVNGLPEIRIDRFITSGLRRFDADRLRWLDEAAALGPIVGLRLGPVKVWAISDAHIARQMLLTDGSSWSRPPAIRSPVQVGVGENLFSQSDRAWARLQPLVAPAFRKKALDTRLATMDKIVRDEIGALPRDTTVDLELATGRLSLRLAAWVLLGDELDAPGAETIPPHPRAMGRWVG
jgi:cytochrome P450